MRFGKCPEVMGGWGTRGRGRLPKGEKLIPTGDLRDDDGSAENASKTLSFVVFFFISMMTIVTSIRADEWESDFRDWR